MLRAGRRPRRPGRHVVCCIHGSPCALGMKHFEKIRDSRSSSVASCSRYDSVNEELSLVSAPSSDHSTDYENLASLQTLMKNTRIGCATPACSPSMCSVMTAAGQKSVIDEDSSEIDGIPKKEVVELYKQYYLGIQSARQSERLVSDLSDFRLYHRISHHSTLANMRTSLRLYIVYLNCRREYRHFPVVERPSANGHGVYLVVNYGNPHPHRFGTLAALLRHYTTYAHVNSMSIEVFPDPEAYKK
ncbi:hypothetical protein QR680_013380 [Steinernema hermaphroditum]|uniref:SH2 domain-containing protein n=1 Tax=Steinernema hermaphroditum TaxID=289476 RepID=A0AA39I851_9BILA|nr:hypothetical protein QR680_013380 [Steinernema hermaphroditum]